MVDQDPSIGTSTEPFVSKPDPIFFHKDKPVTEESLINRHKLNRQHPDLRGLLDEITEMALRAGPKDFLELFTDRKIAEYIEIRQQSDSSIPVTIEPDS